MNNLGYSKKEFCYFMELSELEDRLLDHCYNMGILKKNSTKKKKDSILDSLVAAIVRSGIKYEEVLECIDDVSRGCVIDLNFFKEGGNVEDYINDRWLVFAKHLWRQRSVGLGTPNAASGEGELMFAFLSGDINKPVKGDLCINGENIEIKGENVRVMGKVSGKEFRRRTLKMCNSYGLNPNISLKTHLAAVEMEKIHHEQYWRNEISKLDLEGRIKFVSDYFSCMDDDSGIDFSILFNDGELDFGRFRKMIVKVLYRLMVKDRCFDKFIILGDGSNVKIISNDLEKFDSQIDNGNIVILSDYFRINQDSNLGWYIS